LVNHEDANNSKAITFFVIIATVVVEKQP